MEQFTNGQAVMNMYSVLIALSIEESPYNLTNKA